jgi:uncharacterized protein (DUF1330 family)
MMAECSLPPANLRSDRYVYVISEIEILDETAAKSYMKLAEYSITKYEGRYLVRGANAEVMEGEPSKRKVVIVEFSSKVFFIHFKNTTFIAEIGYQRIAILITRRPSEIIV